MLPPLSALRARVRTTGGRLVRRLGLLPGGDPDGLGEDARLGDLVLDARVVAFFPEPPVNGYQLEQWLGPLQALAERSGVVVVTQDSRTTRLLRDRTSLPVFCIARSATLDAVLSRSDVALALYVSHHPRNFQMLRFPTVAHVYLGHGESDKAVSASNQMKAYDRVFVAGQAAEERVLAELMWFEAGRLVRIGRPQAAGPHRRPGTGRTTVLYAPTWEGAQPSMAYSSVPSHGPALVESLMAAGFRVVYRPHPRTGANRRDVAAADTALRELFTGEQARITGSTVETDALLEDAFADADALVTDISSVAVEWLPTGRPLVVTVPAEPGAVVSPSPLLDSVPRLTTEQAGSAGDLVRRCLDDETGTVARSALIEHYLGGADPAAALDRFLDACSDLVAARDLVQSARPQGAR